jgi:predicted RNase H-like nuclease (RuvC/YqgF family)
MNNKAILNKVRELLGMEVKLEQRKLEDGITVIEADEFVAENEVVIITEDEQRIPLPIGEYKMEDGMILVITEEGIIAEIKEEAAEEEVKEEEEVAVEEEEEMAVENPVKKTVESIVREKHFSEIENLKKENKELKAQIEKLSKEETKEEVVLSEVKDEEKTELTTEELDPAVKPISFNPENKKEAETTLYAQSRTETTLDRVFRKLNK